MVIGLYDYRLSGMIAGMSFWTCIFGIIIMYRNRGSTRLPKQRPYNLEDKNQIINEINEIKEKFKGIEYETYTTKSLKKIILIHLYNLKLYYTLSNEEYFSIVGEIYQTNPKLFMGTLYSELRYNLGKIYGDKGIKELDMYILDNYCFAHGEHISYKCDASIHQKFPKLYTVKVRSGYIVVTNKRIIALGNLKIEPHSTLAREVFEIGPKINPKKGKNMFLTNSEDCYGYMFPLKEVRNLYSNYGAKKIKFNDTTTIYIKSRDQGQELLETLKSFSRE